jgi:hypothetical protein
MPISSTVNDPSLDLLIGYSATSHLSDFVTAAADGGAHTKLIIDYDGTGVSSNSVTIILKNVAYTTDLLTNLIANGNLVLEAINPTLMITGSGGANTAANTISFNFSAAIKDGSFAVDDIGITNGTINSGISLPPAPVKVSLPAPPTKMSSVVPPVSVSLPPKPCRALSIQAHLLK